MRVLGIDPGLTTTGYAVLDGGPPPCLVAFGTVVTSPAEDHPRRLARLHGEVSDLLSEHRPDVVAIERLFFSVNVQTAISVAQAAGATLAAAGAQRIPVFDYTPPEVKQSVAGVGAASKRQVQRMVASVLSLSDPPEPADAADACALALCHLHRSGLTRAIARVARAAAPGSGLARAIQQAQDRQAPP